MLLSSLFSVGLTPGLEEANHYFIHSLSNLKCETETAYFEVSLFVDETAHIQNQSCPLLVALVASTQSHIVPQFVSSVGNVFNFIDSYSQVFEKIHIKFVSNNHFARGPPSLSSPIES